MLLCKKERYKKELNKRRKKLNVEVNESSLATRWCDSKAVFALYIFIEHA